MRCWRYWCLVIILFSGHSCQRQEEIIPLPPHGSGGNPPPPANPEEYNEEEKPEIDFDAEVFNYGTFGNLPYRFLIPRNLDSSKTYPLHVFLHGIGERGRDNEKHVEGLSPYFLSDSICGSYPAFVVLPQCPSDAYWFSEEVLAELSALIDNLSTSSLIDKRYISVGGFSMGAYGTFALLAINSERFEAAVAISGDGDETQARRMASPRWHLFAGGRDEVVPSSRTEKMERALEKAGASVQYHFYPAADHGGTLHEAFTRPGFFHWLFKKTPGPQFQDGDGG